MDTLPKLIQDCIANDHVIERKEKKYYLKENEITYQFQMPSNKSYGFRIEKEKLKLFGGNPPIDIAKMCDALFVIQDNNGKDFIFAVEIKSKHKKDYKKQLFNGVYFCQWLTGLLKEYGHYKAEPQYIGLLIKEVNPSQPAKNLVVRSAEKKPISYRNFKIYETNKPLVSFGSLIKRHP